MRPVRTTGARDSFNAGLAVALASGATLDVAVQFAVVTQALAGTKEGVIAALPRRDEVLAFYRNSNLLLPMRL